MNPLYVGFGINRRASLANMRPLILLSSTMLSSAPILFIKGVNIREDNSILAQHLYCSLESITLEVLREIWRLGRGTQEGSVRGNKKALGLLFFSGLIEGSKPLSNHP